MENSGRQSQKSLKKSEIQSEEQINDTNNKNKPDITKKLIFRAKMATFFTMDVFAIIGTILLLFNNSKLFLFGRLIQGFVTGGNYSMISMFMKEYAPNELFNELNFLIIVMLVAGQVSSFIVGCPISLHNQVHIIENNISIKTLFIIIVIYMILQPLPRMLYTDP